MKRFVLCFMLCLMLPFTAWAGAGDPVTQGKAITGTLLFDVGATIDEFSTTLADDDTNVPTGAAIKTYGDANWGGGTGYWTQTGNDIYYTTGNVGVNTTDFDGTPPIGRFIAQGTTADGTTNIIVGRDSAGANVYDVDTDGNVDGNSFISVPTSEPEIGFKDSDQTDPTEKTARIYENATTLTDDAVISDMIFQAMSSTPGTLTTFLQWDGSKEDLIITGGLIISKHINYVYIADPIVADHGANAETAGSIQEIVETIGSNEATIYFPNTFEDTTVSYYHVTTALTIPANVTLRFDSGAMLELTGAAHITMNGKIEAGLNQIFKLNSTGRVNIAGAIYEVYPEWWGAVGSGGDTTDDTTAFQAAINSITNAGNTLGIGGTVHIPAGVYYITALDLYRGASLVGESPFFSRSWDHAEGTPRGTWLYCTDISDPVISMYNWNAVKNVCFFYPNQNLTSSPVAYPATIYIKNYSQGCLIRDVTATNPYIFLQAAYLNDYTYTHIYLTVENVRAYALYRGIILDGAIEPDKFINVTFTNSCWNEAQVADPPLTKEWTMANGIAFDLGGTDWSVFKDCFAYGYHTGFYLGRVINSVAQPVQVTLLACAADACVYPLYINKSYFSKVIGFNAVSRNHYTPAQVTEGIFIGSSGVYIEGLRVWGSTNYGIKIKGTASNRADNIIIKGCQIYDYGSIATSDAYGIYVEEYASDVIISDNEIDGQNGGESNLRPYTGGIKIAASATNTRITINSNHLIDTNLYGIELGAGPNGVICTDNMLVTTGGFLDSLGAVQKVVSDNLTY